MARDVETAAFQLEYFAGLVLEMKGYTVPLDPQRLHYTQREPMGVVVLLIVLAVLMPIIEINQLVR